ncbi:hypothetical protein [Spiroplasma culicicola]|uniref:Uncharacterized protein n=1 Tax=Spiroplasma culicicola AES-1 TaxID=1276246 RepID=W6A7T7_9MOLU|nr:hypothetical protein [Spiroplasma culicicola]AHI52940.1 hypothetical protein SCULI_v1c05990 [Spiroplasma culicicola AES-1]
MKKFLTFLSSMTLTASLIITTRNVVACGPVYKIKVPDMPTTVEEANEIKLITLKELEKIQYKAVEIGNDIEEKEKSGQITAEEANKMRHDNRVFQAALQYNFLYSAADFKIIQFGENGEEELLANSDYINARSLWFVADLLPQFHSKTVEVFKTLDTWDWPEK